jgi:hypothetical protein
MFVVLFPLRDGAFTLLLPWIQFKFRARHNWRRECPDGAKKDLLEWSASHDVVHDLATVFSRELLVPVILNPDPDIKITDDNPMNEYFLIRRHVNL